MSVLWIGLAAALTLVALAVVGAVVRARRTPKQELTAAWRQVDVQLQRRHHLTPGLLASADLPTALREATQTALTVAERLRGHLPMARLEAERALSVLLVQVCADTTVDSPELRSRLADLADVEHRITGAIGVHTQRARAAGHAPFELNHEPTNPPPA